MAKLDPDVFESIVRHTPLISIDLIVQDDKGKVLLGKRLNRPAKGFWFVPGGRIFKNESIANAYSRLLKEELGVEGSIKTAEFIGVYEHFYQDSLFSTEVGTHYIVLGYKLTIPHRDLCRFPKEQHLEYCWSYTDDIVTSDNVHPNTKMYFQ